MISNRDFLHVSKQNAHCWANDPLYITVNDDKNVSVILDMFRCPMNGLTVRVTHHDPNSISPTVDLHITFGDALAIAQFILRRLLQIDPWPVRAFYRRLQTFMKGTD